MAVPLLQSPPPPAHVLSLSVLPVMVAVPPLTHTPPPEKLLLPVMVQSLMSAVPATYTPLIVLPANVQSLNLTEPDHPGAVAARPTGDRHSRDAAVTPESTWKTAPLPSIVKRLAPGPSIVIVGADAFISIGDTRAIVCGVLKTVVLKLMMSVPPVSSACWTAQAQTAGRSDSVGNRIERVGDGKGRQELAIFELDQLWLQTLLARARPPTTSGTTPTSMPIPKPTAIAAETHSC